LRWRIAVQCCHRNFVAVISGAARNPAPHQRLGKRRSPTRHQPQGQRRHAPRSPSRLPQWIPRPRQDLQKIGNRLSGIIPGSRLGVSGQPAVPSLAEMVKTDARQSNQPGLDSLAGVTCRLRPGCHDFRPDDGARYPVTLRTSLSPRRCAPHLVHRRDRDAFQGA